MIDNDVQAFLEHHGIMGMHWGIRNDKNTPYQQTKSDIHRIKLATTRTNRINSYASKYPTPQNIHNAKRAQSRLDRITRKYTGQPRSTSDKFHFAAQVAIGVAIVAILLQPTGFTKVKNLHVSNKSSVEQVIREAQKKQFYSLQRMHKEGKMTSEQFKNFTKTLNARYDRKVMDALRGG